MIFPHSFFEDEIRCDFLIPSMIKRSWAAQLEILADLDAACQKAGLSYYAEWGTLLGAIRHGGFIPWDDDLDVCMKRKDYEYLVSNVSSILPDNYSIVSYRSNRDFKQMLCRIVSSDHYRFDPEYMKKYSGLPVALGIDIFPLDFLTDDEEYEKDREERVRLVYEAVNEIAYHDTPVKALERRLCEIEARMHVKINRNGDVLFQLRQLLEKLFGEVDEKDAKYVTLYPIWMGSHTYMFTKDHYTENIRVPFENMTIPVPVHYNEILTQKYGSSYLTPVRSGGAHDYPYVENHINVLREHFGFEWPAYKFSKTDLPDQNRSIFKGDGKTCVFITYSAKAFSNMRSLVRKYIDDGYEVRILPIPKYDIAPDMSGITPSTENVPDEYFTDGLEGAEVTYDPQILGSRPSVIVTNYPYDEYNLITAVDKTYYSKSLRSFCDRLVYVPPFEARSVTASDERAIKLMPSYVCTALATVCDEIVLHSQQMKDRYTECLTAFSGDTYKQVWEDKISVLESSTDEADGEDKNRKRSIMFYIGISIFAENKIKAIDKIKSSFELFDDNKEHVDVVYRTQAGLKNVLADMYPDLYEKYNACDFRESDDTTDIENIDAYYGEASPYVSQFLDAGKPVMIMKCL